MSFASSHELHAHAVAVKCRHRIAFAYEDRRRAIVGHERVFAIGFAHETPFEHLPSLVKAIRTVGYFSQEIVPSHLFHHIDSQHLQRMRVEFQTFENFFKAESLSWLLLKKLL